MKGWVATYSNGPRPAHRNAEEFRHDALLSAGGAELLVAPQDEKARPIPETAAGDERPRA